MNNQIRADFASQTEATFQGSSDCKDWQIRQGSLVDRCQHIKQSGIWADCTFVVGTVPHCKEFRCHRLFLSMSSPVFEAMFYGGLPEPHDRIIEILDVTPEAFQELIDYIYTDTITLDSFELACEVCYAAKKYMLPALVEECTKFLWRDLYPRNACRAFEFAKLFEEPQLMEKSMQMIQCQTREVVTDDTFQDIEHATLCTVLKQDSISAPESLLFDRMISWADKECERRGIVKADNSSRRSCLGEAAYLIRYLTLSATEFADGPAKSGILSQEEAFSLLMNISSPDSWPLPSNFQRIADKLATARKPPILPTANITLTCNLDESARYACRRSLVQEPHMFNASILDCYVTFTVNKDVFIHGIEVPSQIEMNPAGEDELKYNELLYAHLLDETGSRLTYAHFSAKVNYNEMLEIFFNRTIYIKANQSYRVGIVLNKVGNYPSGLCTRRVNGEESGVTFNFCVGQASNYLRDSIFRAIIYSE